MLEREALAKKVLLDLWAGLRDVAIMEKYGLSHQELRLVFKDLFDSGLLLRKERLSEPTVIDGRAQLGEDTPVDTMGERRELQRSSPGIQVMVYEPNRPEVQGMIHDVSEKGIGVTGIEAQVGDLKTLVILGDVYGDVSPFEFQAKCVWAMPDADRDRWAAGFKITRISEEDTHELRKLIEVDIWP